MFYIHHLCLPLSLPPSSLLGGLLKSSSYLFCLIDSQFLFKSHCKQHFPGYFLWLLISCSLIYYSQLETTRNPRVPSHSGREISLKNFRQPTSVPDGCQPSQTSSIKGLGLFFPPPCTNQLLSTFVKSCKLHLYIQLPLLSRVHFYIGSIDILRVVRIFCVVQTAQILDTLPISVVYKIL